MFGGSRTAVANYVTASVLWSLLRPAARAVDHSSIQYDNIFPAAVLQTGLSKSLFVLNFGTSPAVILPFGQHDYVRHVAQELRACR